MTDAEKAALEAADAKWERPPQEFIDMWTLAALGFGGFNDETGYFELNGIIDIDYDEAKRIYATFNGQASKAYSMLAPQPNKNMPYVKIRTLMPIQFWINALETTNMVSYNPAIEVLCFYSSREYDAVSISAQTFNQCSGLKRIIGNPIKSSPSFYGCKALEYVLLRVSASVNIEDSPLLSLETMQYLVENAANTAAITVTVHADVYAKLTDESNEEWHKIWTDAEAKNITFAQP